MRLKPLALGGAAAIALALSANASFAQTNPTTNDTSAPAQTQTAPADSTTNDNTVAPAAKPAVHHYRHHARRAKTADESPAEQQQTADLNKQQLAQVQGQTNVSTAANTGTSDTGNAPM